MELDLRQRLVTELAMRGHLTLQTTLQLHSLTPRALGILAGSLHRSLRSGEWPGQLRKIITANARASTVAELCQAFWNLFPRGPDMKMLEMTLDEGLPHLFDSLYDRLQPNTNDKACLLDVAVKKNNLPLALDLFREVDVQANLRYWEYEELTMYYIETGRPDWTMLRVLVEVPLRLQIQIDPEKYLLALVSRGHQEAAFVVWELMSEYSLRVFNPGLLHRQAIKNCCLEFALELVPYTRREAGYDWTTELAAAGVSAITCLRFLKALADSEGRLEGEYRQLLGREVHYHLYGAAFLGQLLELASQYGWQPPYEALEGMLLKFWAPPEYLDVLRAHMRA